ncbi:MAG: DUF3341 domain-containing protein [Chloroflexi bacterium]|nr:DUF3341 domain-containing protein [Chloroflexota bacterium]
MATKSVLGLYPQAGAAADGVAALRQAGFTEKNFEILTGTPYPEGAFGEHPVLNRLPYFAIAGAAIGCSVALLLVIGLQMAFPLVTGGKPLLSIPPSVIIVFEGTMLGSIIVTVIGLLFESRLPRLGLGLYDPRITVGYIGLLIRADETEVPRAEDILRDTGAEDLIRERGS